MKDNLTEVSFDSLLELEYLDLLERTVESKPESKDAEPLIYDEHYVLLMAAYVAKSFLRIIHFPEKVGEGKDDEMQLLEAIYWVELMEDNIITPKYPGYKGGNKERTEPDDGYLRDLLQGVEFKGFVHPKTYPLLTHINGNPYVPSWHVLKWGKKAIKALEERMKEDWG